MDRYAAYVLVAGLMIVAALAPAAAQGAWTCGDEGSAIMSCTAYGNVSPVQLTSDYPLIVPEITPGFSIRNLADVENGHAAM